MMARPTSSKSTKITPRSASSLIHILWEEAQVRSGIRNGVLSTSATSWTTVSSSRSLGLIHDMSNQAFFCTPQVAIMEGRALSPTSTFWSMPSTCQSNADGGASAWLCFIKHPTVVSICAVWYPRTYQVQGGVMLVILSLTLNSLKDRRDEQDSFCIHQSRKSPIHRVKSL